MNPSSSSPSLVSKRKLKLKKSYQSAKSVDKQIKIFKDMEKVFNESELGFECWNIARQLLELGRSPDEVLSFGTRALRILIANDNTNTPCLGKAFSGFSICIGTYGTPCQRNHKTSLYIAHLCTLLASASVKLKRYNESLSYLNWAERNLSKLEKDDDVSSCSSKCFLQTSVITQMQLYELKEDMGRPLEETVVHIQKTLDINESITGGSCVKHANLYEAVYGSYFRLMDYKEALPCCLKVLEAYKKHHGRKSVETIKLMRNLAVIYVELGEYEKALEQNKLLRNILSRSPPASFDIESDHGDILIGLGKYEEALDVLRRVVSNTDTLEETRASAYFTMARAYCCLEKFAEAEKCLRTGLQYSRKMEVDINVAVRFRNLCCMSRLYEKKKDFENAISLLGRALIISDLSRKILAEGSARLFSLVSLSCEEDKGIPYMEDVLEKLKEKFGAKDCELAHGYRNLGAAYLKSGREELAVKFMVMAKEIMDVALGSSHLDSLKTSQALAETYATMGSYDLAMEIQQKVVEGFTGLGPIEQEKLDEAVSLLEKWRLLLPIGAGSENCAAKGLKCGVSERKGN